MHARAAALFLIAMLALPAHASAEAPRLIYKVDRASAAIVKRHLVIFAQGAVSSGGWKHAILQARKVYIPEAKEFVVEFLAKPPSPKEAVIQSLVPVTATLTTHLPRYGNTSVKVIGETNSVSVPIMP